MTRDEGDGLAPLRALQAENSRCIGRLRGVLIPQQVGMAAAARLLATELPAATARDLQLELKTGALARRWEAARAAVGGSRDEAPKDEAPDAHVPDGFWAALVELLRDQAQLVVRQLVQRSRDWSAQAYRLEGHADELAAQNQRLALLVAEASPARDVLPAPAVNVARSTSHDAPVGSVAEAGCG